MSRESQSRGHDGSQTDWWKDAGGGLGQRGAAVLIAAGRRQSASESPLFDFVSSEWNDNMFSRHSGRRLAHSGRL
jgi:hypothetical protein